MYHLICPVIDTKDPASLRDKSWTIPELERCLQLLLDQEHDKLDICFFFDALDEFDGHPDMLCRFLTCLISRPPTSLTRVKVCFRAGHGTCSRHVLVTTRISACRHLRNATYGTTLWGLLMSASHPDKCCVSWCKRLWRRLKGCFFGSGWSSKSCQLPWRMGGAISPSHTTWASCGRYWAHIRRS